MAGGAVTYDEIRMWARWLELFTARDMADALGVSLEVGEKAIKALLWHGICRDTGEVLSGPAGPEALIGYVPLPKGPSIHATERPPELATPGVYSEVPLRGLPVGMRNGRTRQSGVGNWHPGRRQGKTKAQKEAEARGRASGLTD